MRDDDAMSAPTADRPIYLLRLIAPHGSDARRLRWVLKALARQHGMKCLSIEVERAPDNSTETTLVGAPLL